MLAWNALLIALIQKLVRAWEAAQLPKESVSRMHPVGLQRWIVTPPPSLFLCSNQVSQSTFYPFCNSQCYLMKVGKKNHIATLFNVAGIYPWDRPILTLGNH